MEPSTSRSVSTLAGRPFSNVRSRVAMVSGVSTLTGSSHFVEGLFDRSLSHTYREDKPVEETRWQGGRQAVERKAAAQRLPHALRKPFYRKFVLGASEASSWTS